MLHRTLGVCGWLMLGNHLSISAMPPACRARGGGQNEFLHHHHAVIATIAGAARVGSAATTLLETLDSSRGPRSRCGESRLPACLPARSVGKNPDRSAVQSRDPAPAPGVHPERRQDTQAGPRHLPNGVVAGPRECEVRGCVHTTPDTSVPGERGKPGEPTTCNCPLSDCRAELARCGCRPWAHRRTAHTANRYGDT